MYYAKYGKAFITEMMAELTAELEDFNYLVLTES